MKDFLNIKSISKLHKLLGYEKPLHPLISVVDYAKVNYQVDTFQAKTVINAFYLISLKKSINNKLLYGRQYYDFGEGSMLFMSPSQVFQVSGEVDNNPEGWGLYFHSDLIVGTNLFDKIGKYNFFKYSNSEALHLSEQEKFVIEGIVKNIQVEFRNNLDNHTDSLLVSNIELLLNYCQRFYDRQFLTRGKENKNVLSKFEKLLQEYFDKDLQVDLGLTNLDYFASELNLSKSYLSDLIKKETGKTIKERVHLHIIELAKNSLISSNKSISEIAYNLGFDYPQYFSRLFKSKVGMTPVEYRNLN